jgi:TraM recognition site of TraD and TraG
MMARQTPDPRSDPRTSGPRFGGPQPPPARGIPDGAIVGLLATLLGTTALVWTATALAGLISHGRLPHPLPFEGTPTAIRVLATGPNRLTAAWPGTPAATLPSATAFWITFFVLLALLITLALTMLTAWTRLRRATAAARSAPPGPGAGPYPDPGQYPAPEHYPTKQQYPAPGQYPVPGQYPDPGQYPAPERYPQGYQPAGPGGPPPGGELAPPAAPRPSGGYRHDSPDQLLRSAAPPFPAPRRTPPSAAEVTARIPVQPTEPPQQPSAVPVPAAAAGRAFALPTGAVCLLAPDPAASAAARRDLLRRTLDRATGAVLVVSDDLGLWQARPPHRDAQLFDPLRLTDTDSDARVRWAPHSRCEDPAVAVTRARALLTPTHRPGNSPGEKGVQEAAQTLLRCWLHAAALDDRPFRHVLRWAGGTARQEAVTILRTADPHQAAPGWNGELQSLLGNATDLRESALDRVLSALDVLSDLHVLKACTPESATDAFEVESFLRNRGTLYLTGRAEETRVSRSAHSAMPLLTALVEDVVEHGRRMAVRSSSGRLDPPLLCVLDNVAAVAPLPGLPELMARGGPLGLDTVAVLRSAEQARARWGDRAVHSLWTSADARALLGPADGSLPDAPDAPPAVGPDGAPQPADTAALATGELLLLRSRHPAERVALGSAAASCEPTAANT